MTEQLGVTLFRIAFWLYVAAALAYVGYLVRKSDGLGKAGTVLLIVGAALHTVSIAMIAVALGRLPYLNLFEYMLMFTWGAAILYAVTETTTHNRTFGAFAMPVVVLFAFLAYRRPDGIQQSVMPALQSGWRVPHIASAIMAYSAFLIAFIAAVMYLIRERAESTPESFWSVRLPALAALDRTIYRSIAFGFLMQTLLLITGAIWAQRAWSRYWGWDPKETWALITWLIYAAYLHTRVTMGWRGRRSAILALIGFAAVLLTLYGVSYLMGGLHSYGTM